MSAGEPAPSSAPAASWRGVVGMLMCTGALYGAVVGGNLYAHNAYWFVHVGKLTLRAATTSTLITPSLGHQSKLGYDGQYYYFLALDPRHAKDYMGYEAGYVYARPLYPALARAVSLGSAKRLPTAMLAINLAAVGVGALAIGLWLRARGRSAWFALLYSAFPGLIFCVVRDLTEPLAFALVAVAALAFNPARTSRVALSSALFALAALTRETTIPFAAAGALALALTDRGGTGVGGLLAPRAWRRAAPFLGAAVIPLLVWREIVGSFVGAPTQESTGGAHTLIPFSGLAHYWPWHAQHLLIVAVVVIPALASSLLAVILLRRRTGVVASLLVLVNVAAFVVFLPFPIDVDYGAAGRASLGVVLATIYCLPQLARRAKRDMRLLRGVTILWSAPWYVYSGIILGLPMLSYVLS